MPSVALVVGLHVSVEVAHDWDCDITNVFDFAHAANAVTDTIRHIGDGSDGRSNVDNGGEEDESDEGKESSEDLHCSARSTVKTYSIR